MLNKETPAPLTSRDIQPSKNKQPLKEIQRHSEKLLSEPFTGAQALMLLGIRPPEKGKPVLQLKETPIIEFANNSIPTEHKEMIKKASLNEREEFWKNTPQDERMDKWKNSMNAFFDVYKKEPSKKEELTFLKKVIRGNDKKSLDDVEVTADTIYNTFMMGKDGGNVEFFARRIVDNNTIEEIEQNKDLIKNLGNIYGKNSTKIAELLIDGIANVQHNPDPNTFVKSAQENLNKGNYGDIDIWTALDENSKSWEGKPKEKEQVVSTKTQISTSEQEDEEKAAEKLKKAEEAERVKKKQEKNEEQLKQWRDLTVVDKQTGKNKLVEIYEERIKKEKEDIKAEEISQPQGEKDTEELKAEEVKKEIFDLAESKDQSHAEKLLTDVQEILKKEKEEGKGKLKSTIQETAKEVKEYTREGEVVFIPEGEGKLVVVTDIHGDLKTLKQVIEKSKFIENMETGDKSMQFVQTGDLVDRGPKQVEVLQLVMELKRRYPKNVTIFRADHEIYEGVSDHEFPYKIKEFYGLYLDPKAELDDPLFGGFFKVFEELPRMAVAANGAVMVHGGPAVKPRTLSELGSLPKEETERVFDKEITWGDPVTKDNIENLEKQKAELIQYTQEILDKSRVKGLNDENVIELVERKITQNKTLSNLSVGRIKERLEYLESLFEGVFQKSGEESKEGLINGIKKTLDKNKDKRDDEEVKFRDINILRTEEQKVGSLKQAFEVLKSTPGFYPNGPRAESYWDACLLRAFNYSEDGLQQFLNGVGGKFMLRGHEESDRVSGGDPKMFDGMLWTIHTTGKGSDESYYGSDPRYAVFSLNTQQDKIKEENIVSVW